MSAETIDITITAHSRFSEYVERINRDQTAWVYVWRRQNGYPCHYQLVKPALIERLHRLLRKETHA